MTKRYLLILITYIFAQYSVIIFAPMLYNFSPLDEFHSIIYGNILGFIVGLTIILYILKPEMIEHRSSNKSAPGQIILWTILGIILAYISQIIAINIEVHLFGIKTSSENTATLMDITRSAPVFMVIISLIGPILEEIVFRKIIFGALYKRMNFFIAATISSLLFAVVHQEPQHILIYASMGFVFAFVYVKTNRILVPILAHMTLNTITVLVQFSLTPEDLERMQRQLEQMHILIGG